MRKQAVNAILRRLGYTVQEFSE